MEQEFDYFKGGLAIGAGIGVLAGAGSSGNSCPVRLHGCQKRFWHAIFSIQWARNWHDNMQWF